MAGGGTPNGVPAVNASAGMRRGSIVPWILPAALILLSAGISRWSATETAEGPGRRAGEASLLSAISHRPEFALGFRNFLADLVWLEAVQVSGSPRLSTGEYDRLEALLRTVSRFDPRFVVPYLLGGILLGESPTHANDALDFLAQGERKFPGEWRLPFYAGYIRYFSLADPVEGGMALLRASRVSGSPAYLPLLASRMLSEGNRTGTALDFLRQMVEEERDPRRRVSLEERIRRVEVERDLQLLEGAISEYRARIGSLPRDLHDLTNSGILAGIPEEPYGGKYLLMPNGQVRSDRAPAGRLKVFRRS